MARKIGHVTGLLFKSNTPHKEENVKGRCIGKNIRLITDIMKVTELENIPALAIFIDSKKEFHTVDWNFLFKALQVFNFGSCIQNWIRTFYTDCSSCFINNGFASEFFKMESVSVKVVRSLAPSLFYARKF